MRMKVEPRYSFWFSALIDGELAERPVPRASELITMLNSGKVRLEACIYPKTDQFPRATIDWHKGYGFVFHCFEDDRSRGYFLVSSEVKASPQVEIVLGGQVMERWPPELFVPESLVFEALEFFLESGQLKPNLQWVRTDQFERECVWEGRKGREAWEASRRFPGSDGDV